MNVEELLQERESIQQQFNNLSSPQWVANELKGCQAKYELLTQLIEKEQQNAQDNSVQAGDSNNNKRGKSVSGTPKG